MIQKPRVDAHGRLLSEIPAKNYLFRLLSQDIAKINPVRSLDAGAGELRNYWMFPGKYIGISHNRPAYFRGLARAENAAPITAKGAPEVYLMRLESDFSFLGTFDLCVSTHTLVYVTHPADAVRRLAERLRRGGALFFEDSIDRVEPYCRAIEGLFDTIEVIYYGLPETSEPFMSVSPDTKEPPRAYIDAFEREMSTPNTPGDHQRFYLRACGKKEDALAESPTPEMIIEGSLRTVKNDLPFLKAGSK